MHTLTISAPLVVGGSIGTLPPGQYGVSDQNAFELGLMADRGTARLEPFKPKLFPQSDRVLIVRSGAIGDLLLLSPALESFASTHQDDNVFLCCRPEHHRLFSNTRFANQLVSYPLSLDTAADFREIISLENVMENATDLHATDAFAWALGVSIADYKPTYVISEAEARATKQWVKSARPRVGVQLKASTANRNYPLASWLKVILRLEAKGCEVFIFGLPGQVPTFSGGIKRELVHDMSNEGLSFRESAALLASCDAFVGIDSCMIHLCHAVGVPAVGLFGPFSWQTRTSKDPNTRVLIGRGDCANCRWHAKNGQHFPAGACRTTQVCSVLADIDPDRVVVKVLEALKYFPL